jgi:type I restriction enzyme S subunit
MRIALPPIDEQRRIAAVLDQADQVRAKRRASLARFDALTDSIFLTSLDADAPTVPLGSSILFLTSGARGWARYYAESGARFIRSLDVQMNRISEDAPVWVQAPDSAEARRIRVEDGDVLLTITGSRIGRVAAAGADSAGAFVSQHVAIIRLDGSESDPRFLARYLSMDMGQRQIERLQYGQTKPGLNFEQIRSVRVPQLCLRDQQTVVKRAEASQATAVLARADQDQMESLFASLQQRAFRGEL